MSCPVLLNQQVAEPASQLLCLCSPAGQCCFSSRLGIPPYLSADLERAHQNLREPTTLSVRLRGARPAPASHSCRSRVLVQAVHAQSCRALCDPVGCSLLSSPSKDSPGQGYWSGLSFPSSGDVPGIKATSLGPPVLAGGFFITEPLGMSRVDGFLSAFFQFQIPSSCGPPVTHTTCCMELLGFLGARGFLRGRDAGKSNHHQRALQPLGGSYLQDRWPLHFPRGER